MSQGKTPSPPPKCQRTFLRKKSICESSLNYFNGPGCPLILHNEITSNELNMSNPKYNFSSTFFLQASRITDEDAVRDKIKNQLCYIHSVLVTYIEAENVSALETEMLGIHLEQFLARLLPFVQDKIISTQVFDCVRKACNILWSLPSLDNNENNYSSIPEQQHTGKRGRPAYVIKKTN